VRALRLRDKDILPRTSKDVGGEPCCDEVKRGILFPMQISAREVGLAVAHLHEERLIWADSGLTGNRKLCSRWGKDRDCYPRTQFCRTALVGSVSIQISLSSILKACYEIYLNNKFI
jgi:hypothetical protein